jgi:hypothetical protein
MTAPIRFDVPASFTPLDLTGTSPPDGVADLVTDLRARNACFAALFAEPPDRTGYFAITSTTGPAPDLDTVAGHLAAHLTAEIRRTELPCGPALTFTDTTGTAVREYALVAHPDRTTIVTFTLATNDEHRRPEHAHLFAEILATVTFAQPLTVSSSA